MTPQELSTLLSKAPPVDVLMGILIDGSSGRSEQWFTLRPGGAVIEASADDETEERLVLTIPRLLLRDVLTEGRAAIIKAAADLAFTVEGDFRIFLYYVKEIFELLGAVAAEERDAGRLP